MTASVISAGHFAFLRFISARSYFPVTIPLPSAYFTRWVRHAIPKRESKQTNRTTRHHERSDMRIGIIGAGNVGGNLGKLWAGKGHEVMFGVRDQQSQKVTSLVSSLEPHARAGSVKEAAQFAELVALTTPWEAAREAIQAAGDVRGKILMDCTNPVK